MNKSTLFLNVKAIALLVIVLNFCATTLTAQTSIPSIHFQAVARDNFSNPAKDRKIYVQTSIIQNTATGTVVLNEEHQTTTDGSGVFSINIGGGTRKGGTATNLEAIEWAKGPYFLNMKIAFTPVAPTSDWDYSKEWIDLGTTSFGSVPYALYAGNVTGLDKKLNIADTAAMLSRYSSVVNNLINSNTFAINKDSLALKLNISDSITKYVTPTQLNTKTFDSIHIYNQLALREYLVNKTTNVAVDASSDIKYPSAKAVKFYVDSTIANSNGNGANIVSIANGGTGATSATDARTNLGLGSAATSAVSDFQAPLSFTAPLNNTANTVSIPVASTSVNGYLSATDWTNFNNKIDATQKGNNNGVATLGNDGKIPSSQIPAITFQAATVVASEPAMLAINNAQVGSMAIRTDVNKNYVLNALPASTLSNWTELSTPNSVTSVNGYYGPSVSINTNDVAEGATNKYFTNTLARGSVSGSAPLSYDASTGAFSISQANTNTAGYISASDWNNFNNKQAAFTTQTANKIFASPDGANGVPVFRSITARDIPILNQNTTGNSATATKLATARNINGVAFDGTANITIVADAGTLSGTIAINKGGTGATTAADARTNLGLAIGTDVLAQRTFGTAANSNVGDFQAPLNFTGPLNNTSNTVSIPVASTSVNGYLSAQDWTNFNNKVDGSKLGVANGVATLGNDGKVPSSQIPAVSFQSANVVADQAAMLAINNAQVGSMAIRTDNNKNYVLSALPASTLSNWIELSTPASVTSVNGNAGPAVVLNTNDITEGVTNKYYSNTLARGAVSATTPLSYNASTGNFSIPQANTNTAGYITASDWNNFNNKQAAFSADGGNKIYATPDGAYGTPSFRAITANDIPVLNQNTTGNAATATKLAAAKNINGVAFDGSADIIITADATTLTGNVPVTKGGTGATTASGARTNLGLVIGTDVLAQRTFGTAANSNVGDFQAPLSFTGPISNTGNTVSMPAASTSVSGYLSATDWTKFNNKIDATQKGTNNGVATLGNDGKIPSSQIPAISFQTATVVSSQSAMLAINGALVGSMAIRTDNNKNYVLSALPASTLGNWVELSTPASVTSVNGNAGPSVVLTTNEIAEGSNNKYFSNTLARGAMGAMAPLSYDANAGIVSITQANTSTAGFISASDWNTFNNKQAAFSSQTANKFFASPNGSNGTPTFRAIVAADIPVLNQNTTGNAATATKLATAKNINGVAFDGSSDITVTASGNTLTGVVGVANGGTGATTAAAARTNLGVAIGTDVLAQRTFGTAANSNVGDFQAPLSFTGPLTNNSNTVSMPAASTTTSGYLTNTDWNTFNNKIDATQKGTNNGVATLGNDGKIPSSQIPAISFQSANVVASQAAMLAITGAQVGSMAIRTDNSKNYVLSALPASTLANWIELTTPASVTSVNGNSGPAVTLTTNEIAEGTTNKYYSNSLARAAVSATAPLTYNSTSGTFSITQANTNTDGYISATDWNTFNNKQGAFTAQLANTVYAGPDGSLGSPSFRTLTANDIPVLNQNTTGNAATATKLVTARNINGVAFDGSSDITVTANAATLTGTVAIAHGGTGAITAAAARTNLGLTIGTDVLAYRTFGSAANSATSDFQAPLTFTGPLTNTSNTISIPAATTSANGYLTSTDWNTFNNKQAAFTSQGGNLVFATPNGASGTPSFRGLVIGDLTTTGTANNTSYLRGDGSWAVPTGTGVPYSGATGAVNLGAYDLTVNTVRVGLGSGTNNGYSTAVGNGALQSATTGIKNTAVGYLALQNTTTGQENTAVGTNALQNNTSHWNTAIGKEALVSNTTGSNNTAVGKNALYQNISGSQNIAMGKDALGSNTTGSSNTAIGYQANVGANNLNNATAIGANAVASASNMIQLGDGGITNVKTSGTITAGTVTYPNTDGTANQILTTNGSGVVSWTNQTTTVTASNITGSTLASNVTTSSLTGVGTITSGTWNGATIALANGGTGATTASAARTNLGLGTAATSATSDFQAPLSFTAPLTNTSNTVSIPAATSSANGYLSSTDWTTFNNKIDATQKGSNNGVATLGSDGKIPSSQIPAISFQSVNVVASESAMLALTGTQVGSMAVRTDNGRNYVLSVNNPSVLSNWVQLNAPAAVTSVNGNAGPAVVLTTNEIAEGSTNKYYSNTLARAAVSASAPLAYNSTTGAMTIAQANTSTAGYLSAADWNTFNNKLSTATAASTYVPYTGASGSVNLGGYDMFVNGVKIGKGAANKTDNTALGNSALNVNTTGSGNTAVGYFGLKNNTTGSYNTATGEYALFSNTTGANNTANGGEALWTNTTGSNNTALGTNALNNSSTGSNNTAVGRSASFYNTTGTSNTAVGDSALFITTSGNFNTALGRYALSNNTTGEYNTALGHNAGTNSAALNNTTAIGNGALVTASNTIQLGNTSVTNVKTSGTVTAGAVTYPNTDGTANQVLTTNGSGSLTWSTIAPSASGVQSVAAISTTSNANGATISGTTINLTAADASNGGVVTTGTQTFAGNKIFNGNIGMGTSAPTAKMHIVGGDRGTMLNLESGNNATISLKNTGSGGREYQIFATNNSNTGATGGSLGFYDNYASAYRMVLDPTGKLGIGNNTPAEKLDVVGNIKASGTLVTASTIQAGTVVYPSAHGTSGQVLSTNGSGALVWKTPAVGVPYTGATGNVDLGNNNNFYANGVKFGSVANNKNTTSGNILIGSEFNLSSNTTGTANIGIGNDALNMNTTGYYNVGIGQSVLNFNIDGYNNTAIGHAALYSPSHSNNLTIIGYFADASEGITNATAIGSNATVTESNTIQMGDGSITKLITSGKLVSGNITYPNTDGTSGQVLTTNGSGTLSWANASSSSTGVPYTGATGSVNLGPYDLTVNGLKIGKGNNSSSANTALGVSALNANAVGANNNTAIGYNAAVSNTSGAYNTANGAYALNSNTSGFYNTVNGYYAATGNISGAFNTAIGDQALATNTVGNHNTAIGHKANVSANNLSNATAIGDSAIATASNTIQLGNTSVTNVNTSGKLKTGAVTYPNTDGTANQVLTTNGAGTLSWATNVVNGFNVKTQAEIDAITPTEGQVVYNSTTHKPNYYNGTDWLNFDGSLAKILAIGVAYKGGKIFYILQPGDPGYVAGETHGFIAATSDQSTGTQWYNNNNYTTTSAVGVILGTGSSNTNTIINSQGGGNYAAKLCSDYRGGGYSDWYLPSKDELNKLYINQNAVGGFSSSSYWSSSEGTTGYAMTYAWAQTFGTGRQFGGDKSITYILVRAIRSF